jgi:hypothetical protein
MDQVFDEAQKKRQAKSLEGLPHKQDDFQGVKSSEICLGLEGSENSQGVKGSENRQEVKSSDTFQDFKSSTEAHMTGQQLESTEIQPQARSSEGATPEHADFQGVTRSAEAQGMGYPRIESTLEWILSLLETFRKDYFQDHIRVKCVLLWLICYSNFRATQMQRLTYPF